MFAGVRRRLALTDWALPDRQLNRALKRADDHEPRGGRDRTPLPVANVPSLINSLAIRVWKATMVAHTPCRSKNRGGYRVPQLDSAKPRLANPRESGIRMINPTIATTITMTTTFGSSKLWLATTNAAAILRCAVPSAMTRFVSAAGPPRNKPVRILLR